MEWRAESGEETTMKNTQHLGATHAGLHSAFATLVCLGTSKLALLSAAAGGWRRFHWPSSLAVSLFTIRELYGHSRCALDRSPVLDPLDCRFPNCTPRRSGRGDALEPAHVRQWWLVFIQWLVFATRYWEISALSSLIRIGQLCCTFGRSAASWFSAFSARSLCSRPSGCHSWVFNFGFATLESFPWRVPRRRQRDSSWLSFGVRIMNPERRVSFAVGCVISLEEAPFGGGGLSLVPDCRRSPGAPYMTWGIAQRGAFLAGFAGRSTSVAHAGRVRGFAACCGTQILF